MVVKLMNIITFSIFLFFNSWLVVQGLDSEVPLDFVELAKKQGYYSEFSTIVTEDDYITTLYRIPRGIEESESGSKNKSVILILHGMGGSPFNMILLGKKIAPAFYFADRGFDVWLMCTRGVNCQNPKKHKTLDPIKDKEYWLYSKHEIGVYDIAASIDHIVNVTGQQSVFFIGHSAGSPEILALLSERPEYNDKIKIACHWGGGAILKHINYPLASLLIQLFGSGYMKNLFFKTLGITELTGLGMKLYKVLLPFAKAFCTDPKFKKICPYLIPGMLNNVKSTLIEKFEIEEWMFDQYQKISLQQVYHYVDNVISGDFRKYNFGPNENMKIYGQKNPPLYNLSACTAMNAFFYGTTDSFSTPINNRLAMEQLPNTLGYEIGPKFGHVDFILARNATHMLYEPMVKLFNDFDDGKIQPKTMKTELYKE